MQNKNRSREDLLAENETLRFRLEEAEETLEAIRNGAVDAVVVSLPQGERIFTLEGADQPYRVLVENMSEGAATLAPDGTILYCNNRIATMLQVPLEKLMGTRLCSHVAREDLPIFHAGMEKSRDSCSKDEIILITGTGTALPVLISCCAVDMTGSSGIQVVITDLSEQKRNQEIVASEKLARSIIDQAGEAILVCDENGVIIRASLLAHQLCGENPLLKPFDEMYPLQMSGTGEFFCSESALQGEIFRNTEVTLKRRDDQEFHLLLNSSPLKSGADRIIGCVLSLHNVTELKEAEQAIRKSLHEKEVLLKEVHHRVKNNMQVISSLVSLQAFESENETVRKALEDVSDRVRSMALVHEKLYRSADLSHIDFAEYARSLLSSIWRSHGAVASSIRLDFNLEQVHLPVDTAVPCGLILNELAGNALKHAFQGLGSGVVTVFLHAGADGRIRLCVRDNGVGLPEGLDWRSASSLGLRLVAMLAGQIKATVEVDSREGTAFELIFGETGCGVMSE
jgi:two-component sensor histidine kinase